VLSADSTHPVVEGAGHSTLQTDQEDAQVTSAAIDQVVEAVRTDRPLTHVTPAAGQEVGSSVWQEERRASATSGLRDTARRRQAWRALCSSQLGMDLQSSSTAPSATRHPRRAADRHQGPGSNPPRAPNRRRRGRSPRRVRRVTSLPGHLVQRRRRHSCSRRLVETPSGWRRRQRSHAGSAALPHCRECVCATCAPGGGLNG
jgi:hypothetical protein